MTEKRFEFLMMLQIHRSDTPIAVKQLLTDLPPLQHGDLTFNMNIYMYVQVYSVQYNRQFLRYKILNT